MNELPYRARRNGSATHSHHRHHSTNRALHEIPRLTKSNSGSSSSSPNSNELLSATRIPKNRINHIPPSASSDNSIIRGAEILRRQLIQNEGLDDNDYDDYEARAISSQDSDYLEPQDDEHDDWGNPWKVNPARSQHGRQVDSSRDQSPYRETGEDKAFSFPVQGDASEWAHLSDSDSSDDGDEEDTVAILQRAQDLILHQPTRIVSPETSPDSQGHRGHSRRVNEEQFLVQRVDDMDNSTFASSLNDAAYLPEGLLQLNVSGPNLGTVDAPSGTFYASSGRHPYDTYENPLDLLKDLQSEEEGLLMAPRLREEEEMAYLLEQTRKDRNVCMMALPTTNIPEKSPNELIVSPRDPQYGKLLRDPGFCHAQRAGILWQSLASQHVRFPSKWWNGSRFPPMGVGEPQAWTYLGRHRVRSNTFLKGLVRNRGSAGRLLLHIVIRDIMTLAPVQDIAIGCFHPNARGVRTTPAFNQELEDCRDIWLAFRRRVDDVSVIESLLGHGNDQIHESPLGGKHAVDNTNMRTVFGETPPVSTIFVVESDLFELFSQHLDRSVPPAAILLQEYLQEE